MQLKPIKINIRLDATQGYVLETHQTPFANDVYGPLELG
jgi:hypothetical protein